MTLNGTAFALALVFGIGAGLLMSQLGNVIMSSSPPDQTNEAGGLQGDGAEPRSIARHGADRLGAPARPSERVQRADPGQPRSALRRQGADLEGHRDRHPDRHNRPGVPGSARRRSAGGRRDHGHRRLRQRAARCPEDIDARRCVPGGALGLVHAALTRKAGRSRQVPAGRGPARPSSRRSTVPARGSPPGSTRFRPCRDPRPGRSGTPPR